MGMHFFSLNRIGHLHMMAQDSLSPIDFGLIVHQQRLFVHIRPARTVAFVLDCSHGKLSVCLKMTFGM